MKMIRSATSTAVDTAPRPSFRLTGTDGIHSEYVSAGVIFYVTINGTNHFLMQKHRDRLEDFGGKSAPGDRSIEDVIIRETMEELNMLAPLELQPKANPITKGFLARALPVCGQFLLSRSKYVLCFVRLPGRTLFDLDQFGEAEYGPDGTKMVDRKLMWISRAEVMKSPLHPRLASIKGILP